MIATDRQSVLVTGASGFIGTHLVFRLVARGLRVSCLVRTTSQVDALRAAGGMPLVCDIGDRDGLARALSATNAGSVFHLAGRVRAKSAREFMRVNAEGVEAVAAACARQAVRPVLVLISSLAAAGPARERPMTESDPPLPVSDYGRSKLAGEHVAAQYADVLPITIVRPGIVFGPGDRGVYQVFKPIARAGVHIVAGPGNRRVSLVAVEDVVDCLVLAAERGERMAGDAPGRGIYFAAAEDLSHVELGRAIAAALGQEPPRIVHLPEWSMRAAGLGGDVISQVRRNPGWLGTDKVSEMLAGSWTCSAAKARQHLGWSPAVALPERLRETAQWYRNARWL